MHNPCITVVRLITGVVLVTTSVIRAEPAISVNKSSDQGRLTVNMNGSGLPEIKSITLTCTFDLQRIALMDAIISSPLPATGISAYVDASDSSLVITVQATTTMVVADNALFVKLLIPVTVQQGSESAFTLLTAEYIDASGTGRTAAITTTASTRHVSLQQYRPPSLQKKNASLYFHLNGRCCRKKDLTGTAGYIIQHSNENTAFGKVTLRQLFSHR